MSVGIAFQKGESLAEVERKEAPVHELTVYNILEKADQRDICN
jgi:hypothetical protein